MHPYVLVELALGSLGNRQRRLEEFELMKRPEFAGPDTVRTLVEANSLWSRGLGFVDAALLASARLTLGVTLWTSDKRLHEAAVELGIPALNPRTVH